MQKLAKKIVEVMKECGHVAKNGSNDYHHYDYAKAADVMAMVNDSLTKHGIMTTAETNLLEMREVTTSKGNSETLATVETIVTLIDSESGEILKIKGLGSGQDAGDKGIAKAQTQAIKYTFLSSFAIATGDDPEADTRVDEVMNNKTRARTSATTTKNKPVCHDCGVTITQRVADFSKSKFGKHLCMNCQKLRETAA